MESREMLCPICRSVLQVIRQEPLETMEDHIYELEPTEKDSFGCANPECVACTDDLCWNWYGGYYGAHNPVSGLRGDEYPFIDGNHAPFGSFERKQNAEEQWRHRVNFWINLPSISRLVKFKTEFEAEADDNGEIVKRHFFRRPSVWISNGHGGHRHYLSGVHMLIFSIRNFLHHKKVYAERRAEFARVKLIDDFEGRTSDRRWWRRVFRKFIHRFYGGLLCELRQ